MWAAAEDHPAAVKLLIERGADVSARSNPASLGQDRVTARRAARAAQVGVEARGAPRGARREPAAARLEKAATQPARPCGRGN